MVDNFCWFSWVYYKDCEWPPGMCFQNISLFKYTQTVLHTRACIFQIRAAVYMVGFFWYWHIFFNRIKKTFFVIKPWINQENSSVWGKWIVFLRALYSLASTKLKEKKIEWWCFPVCLFQLNGMENYTKLNKEYCADLLNCLEMEVFIQAFTWRLWRLVPLN